MLHKFYDIETRDTNLNIKSFNIYIRTNCETTNKNWNSPTLQLLYFYLGEKKMKETKNTMKVIWRENSAWNNSESAKGENYEDSDIIEKSMAPSPPPW